jgi:hypothetical protein
MRKRPTSVIPSAARDLVFSATYEEEISRLHLEMTVATQSVRGGRHSPKVSNNAFAASLNMLTDLTAG